MGSNWFIIMCPWLNGSCMEEEQVKCGQVDGKNDINSKSQHILHVPWLAVSQLVYQGKISSCLPKFQFPSGCSITFSENHWCNEDSYYGIVHNDVIVPDKEEP